MNNIRQTYVSVRAGPPPRRGHQVTIAIARAGATQGSAKRQPPGCVSAAGKLVEAEVISNIRNKIHQTWHPPFSRTLYRHIRCPRARRPPYLEDEGQRLEQQGAQEEDAAGRPESDLSHNH